MSDFWSKRLGAPVAAPATPPVTPAQLPPQFQHVGYAPPMTNGVPDQGATEAPRQAASARQHDLCPSCGSRNYLSVQGAKARCYDCGYPVEQSTSGAISTTSQGGAAAPAQQASGYSGGFQPNVIINK